MNNYEHFVTIVAGENPDELMKPYQANVENIPHVLYYYKDASKLRNDHITMVKAMLTSTLTEAERNELNDILSIIENQSDDEFFEDLAEEYDIDETTGDIITFENPIQEFSTYQIGKNFSSPFILKDGTTAFQAKKQDIDWEKLCFGDKELYMRTWELAVEDAKPLNDIEKTIKKNMKNRKDYFNFFKNKETYALHCSAFWGYAFVSENTGWKSLSYDMNQIDWVVNYYDNFIVPLSENTLLTIFECRK